MCEVAWQQATSMWTGSESRSWRTWMLSGFIRAHSQSMKSQDDGPHIGSPARNIQMLRAVQFGKKRGLSVGCWNEKRDSKDKPSTCIPHCFPFHVVRCWEVASFCVHQNIKSIVWSWQAQASAMQKHGCDRLFGRWRLFLSALWICFLACRGRRGPHKAYMFSALNAMTSWYWHGICRIAWKHAPSVNYKRTKRNQ